MLIVKNLTIFIGKPRDNMYRLDKMPVFNRETEIKAFNDIVKELQQQEDLTRIKRIAANTIEVINKANEEPDLGQREKNAAILRDVLSALQSIAKETETIQKAIKITKEVDVAITEYNAYIKRIKKEKMSNFIKDHVEILVKD